MTVTHENRPVVTTAPPQRSDNSSGHLAGVYDGSAPVVVEPGDSDESWSEPPNLPGQPDPETLPVDVLPPALLAHVLSVSDAMQVPADMPCLLSLACVSAAVAGRVEVEAKAGWREPVNIYTGVILPPASRKSPCYAAMTAPVREWESEQIMLAAPKLSEKLDKVAVCEKTLARAIDAAGKGGDDAEVVTARKELTKAQADVPLDGRLLAGNITPEAIQVRMAAQGDRLAILEPEPGPLQILSGRYDSKRQASLDELKKAHDGELMLTDRISRQSGRVERPALTLGIMLQPGVLEGLANADAFRREGVLARFLWCVPPHGLGRRLTGAAVPPLDRSAAEEYRRVMRKLLDLSPLKAADDGTVPPHVLGLAADAQALRFDFEAEVEPKLDDGGAFAEVRDWAGKMVGEALRVAAHLSLARRVEEGSDLFAPIDGNSMAGAVALLRALSTHALHVLAGGGGDGRTADMRYLLRRLGELPTGVTESELRAASRGRASIGADENIVTDLLDELEDRNCIRRVHPQPTGDPGRPPSPIVELHPDLRQEREVVDL